MLIKSFDPKVNIMGFPILSENSIFVFEFLMSSPPFTTSFFILELWVKKMCSVWPGRKGYKLSELGTRVLKVIRFLPMKKLMTPDIESP